MVTQHKLNEMAAEIMDKNREDILFLIKTIDFMAKKMTRIIEVIEIQQIRLEELNKSMLNFIPDKDRKGNQIIQ